MTSSKWRKLGFWSGQFVANTGLQNKQDLPTVCRSLLLIQPTLWFCCQANSRAPKVGQVFPYATCNNHSRLFCLWTDPLWSWCYSLEKFNCRGWCVVLSAVHKVFGWLKFPQPTKWTNFPHGTLCVWLNDMMAKLFWRHYDINNLTQEKAKEELKETVALAVVTDGQNNKTKKTKNKLGICTQEENTGRDMCCFVCRLLC